MDPVLYDCTSFLQWALPQMQMRWDGFRKVRGQVCKRIRRRMVELGLSGFSQYQSFLQSNTEEWKRLDAMCIVTISRFFRDRQVFEFLGSIILPELAETAKNGSKRLRCWSAGCASGEEPYALSIIWEYQLAKTYPDIAFTILATDVSLQMLERARKGNYQAGSLRDLPVEWKRDAFSEQDDSYHILPMYQERVGFLEQDIRRTIPEGPFDLVLCRNLIWFYFDEALQTKLHERLLNVLSENGVLVIGGHEHLPGAIRNYYSPAQSENLNIYTKLKG